MELAIDRKAGLLALLLCASLFCASGLYASKASALDDLGVVSGDTFELPGYNDGPSGGGVWPGSSGSGGEVGAMPLPNGAPDTGGSPHGGPGGGGGPGSGEHPKADQTRPPYLSPKSRNTPKATAPFNSSIDACSDRSNLKSELSFQTLMAPVDTASADAEGGGSNLPVPRNPEHAKLEHVASTAMNSVRMAYSTILRYVRMSHEDPRRYTTRVVAEAIEEKMVYLQETMAKHFEWAKIALGCENLDWLKKQNTDRAWRIWAKAGYGITRAKIDLARGSLETNPHVLQAPIEIQLMIAKLELLMRKSTGDGIKALYQSNFLLAGREEGLGRYFLRMYLAHGGTAKGITDPYEID